MALVKSQGVIGQLERIRDNPHLGEVVGGLQGRLPAVGGEQANLVNDIEDANNALQGSLFTGLRGISGRGVSPGALKEMRISDLQAGRTGTVEGYKSNINGLIKKVQDETDAAWVGSGSPAQYKPQWGSTQQAAPQQQAIPPAQQREVGKLYMTPKGPHKWLGNGWEAPNAASL